MSPEQPVGGSDLIARLREAFAGRYEVERAIGQGGMAIVFLARDVRHSRQVAIKILKPHLVHSVGAERFLREIQTTAQIVHPHVLPLHDSGEVDGFLYYTMPFVSGESLAERLKREGALPLMEALRIAREVADGLAHAHALQLVHRDVKPGNILLVSGAHACIADFGLARARPPIPDVRLTHTGTVVGSPIYMSPEQIRGSSSLDGRADVYSLGCMLFEMLTGRPPVGGYTIEEVLGQHLMGTPARMDTLGVQVPAAVEAAVLSALEKSPDDRPSAEEFFHTLEGLERDLGGRSGRLPRPGGGLLRWIPLPAGLGGTLRPLGVATAVLATLGLGWAGWHATTDAELDAATADEGAVESARIAVLFFDDHSPGGDLGYLASGLTEGLIQELGRVDGLEVVSRNGVKPFQGAAVAIDSIARALGVASLVEGSVTRSGERIRVSVQLVDGRSAVQLESRSIEAAAGDLFALQDSVVQEVARSLREALGREIRLRQTRRGTQNQRAWELVLRAGALQDDFAAVRVRDGALARRYLARADSALARASVLDPAWSHPHVMRGWLARDLALLDGPLPGQLQPRWAERALAHVEEAARLDPRDASAYELRGLLRLEYARDPDPATRRRRLASAEGDLRRAVELDPRRSRAWWALSELLSNRGDFSEAGLAAEHAFRADAFLENAPNVLHQIYYNAIQVGPSDDAIRPCDEGRRRFPTSGQFIVCQLFILASFPDVKPDVSRALVLADSLVQVVPVEDRESFRSYGTMLVAEVAARAGLRDSTYALVRAARGDSIVDWLAYNEAHAYALLGESDRAIQLLSRYLATDTDTASIARDWWFDRLRSHPAFLRLVGDSRRASVP